MNADVAVSPSLIFVCNGFEPAIDMDEGSEQVTAIDVGGPWAPIEAGSINWVILLMPAMPFMPIMGDGGKGFITAMAMWWGDIGDRGPAIDTGVREAGSKVKVLCNSMLRMREKKWGNIRHKWKNPQNKYNILTMIVGKYSQTMGS